MRIKSAGIAPAVYSLFLISGFTGLAYEVIWTRMLVRSLGATSLAVTTVLASFMAGLALGSFFIGRLIDRRGNPILVYGLLELGIGAFALLFPALLILLNSAYSLVYPALQGQFYLLSLLRFFLSFVVLMIPTTMMGGTLPVLSKFMATSLSTLTGRVGRLYALNTLGAVAGAFGTGFVLLPALGIRQTTWLCAAINFGILAVALALSKKHAEPAHKETPEPQPPEAPSKRPAGRRSMILGVFAATGFCALAVEVLWTRILSLVVGTTVYAFAIMLTTFLLGLAAGSNVFAGIAQRTKRVASTLAAVVAAIGLTVFLSNFAFGRLPLLYMAFYERAHPDWVGLTWIQFALCSVIMLVPAFLMGAVFPLVARLYASDVSRVGSQIGEIYAFNTVGAILGSIAGSFVLLRLLGAIASLILLSMVYLAIAIVLFAGLAEFRRRYLRLAAAGCIGALALALLVNSPTIDKKMMTSGVYRYARVYKTREALMRTLRQSKTLFYNEGLDATVTVERFQDEITLAIDGKVDASTGIDDMTTQVLLAHLPLLFHPQPDTVLVIGLGSGVTLGSAERHSVVSLDCVELLENVVDASGYFRSDNYDCLSDPRTSLIIGDARNHLLLTHKKYDVIISEPTNPWISGVGDLFTSEFFAMAKARLNPDGIMCAWFHTYHMGDDDLKTMVRTFRSVFPEATLWMTNDTDLIFLGSTRPLALDDRLIEKMREPAIAGDLARIWIHEPEDLISAHVAGPQVLLSFAETAKELNTDDNMLLEFSAGARVLEATERTHLLSLLRIMEPPPLDRLGAGVAEMTRIHAEARKTATEGSTELLDDKAGRAMELFERAYQLAPGDPYVLNKYIEGNLALANVFYSEGDYDEAGRHYHEALVEPDYPTSWLAYIGLGVCYLARRDLERAYHYTLLAAEKNPHSPDAYFNLGTIAHAGGDIAEAIRHYEQALKILPHAGAANGLSRILLENNRDLLRALDLADLAVSLEDKPAYFNTLGWAYHSLLRLKEARRALKKALDLDHEDSEALFRLGMVELSAANPEAARSYFERAVELGHRDFYTRSAETKLRELRNR